MANVINWGTNVLTAELVRDLKEVLYLEGLGENSIEALHTIVNGIKSDKQIMFMGELNGPIGKTLPNDCSMPANTSTIPVTTKTWTPKMFGNRFDECAGTLIDTAAIYSTRNKIDFHDLTNTDWAKIFMIRLGKSMNSMYWRLAWFGDTTATNFNGSPAGEITDGVSTDFITGIDGIFKQMKTYVALGTEQAKQKVTIAGNAEASYAAQTSWGTTVAGSNAWNNVGMAALQMRYSVPVAVRQRAGSIALCTQLFYDALEQNFLGKGLESMFVNFQNGLTGIKVVGITYIPVPQWDEIINYFHNTGTKWVEPYRVAISPKENLQIGTTAALTEVNTVKMFYSDYYNKVYTDIVEEFDAKVVFDNAFILGI